MLCTTVISRNGSIQIRTELLAVLTLSITFDRSPLCKEEKKVAFGTPYDRINLKDPFLVLVTNEVQKNEKIK